MASSPQRHAATPQLDTAASAIVHPDPDDLVVVAPSVDPPSVATLDSQDFANPGADWLYFVNWPVAVIQTAVPREPARVGPTEPTKDAAPIATDAPAAAVAEQTVAIAAAVAGCQDQAAAAVAVVDRFAVTTAALAAEEDSEIDAPVASEMAAVVAVC